VHPDGVLPVGVRQDLAAGTQQDARGVVNLLEEDSSLIQGAREEETMEQSRPPCFELPQKSLK
jgi:hypothetical protein